MVGYPACPRAPGVCPELPDTVAFEAALGWGLPSSPGGLGLEIASRFSSSPRKGVPTRNNWSGILMGQKQEIQGVSWLLGLPFTLNSNEMSFPECKKRFKKKGTRRLLARPAAERETNELL